MELAPMFTEQRWNILQHLAMGALSPLQLAGVTGTTIANISQQLRLLEATGLVKKRKVPNRQKGQPRTLFFIPENYAFLVVLSENFAGKALVRLNREQENLLKILSIQNEAQRQKIYEAYLDVRKSLKNATAVAADTGGSGRLIIVTVEAAKKPESDNFVFLTREQARKLPKPGLIVLNDEESIFKS